MATTDWYSYKVGEGDCDFTGYVHIISPAIHTVLFYLDGAPEVSVTHFTRINKIECAAWAPDDNRFQSATIQKGK